MGRQCQQFTWQKGLNFTFQITCISGIDYPNYTYRFQIVYELLSLKFNNRTRIKCFVNELIPVTSVENVFLGANWWEWGIWDMFGFFF